MKVGILFNSVMPIHFFLMKGTTAETGMEVTTAIKLHCVLTVFIDNGDSFIII